MNDPGGVSSYDGRTTVNAIVIQGMVLPKVLVYPYVSRDDLRRS